MIKEIHAFTKHLVNAENVKSKGKKSQSDQISDHEVIITTIYVCVYIYLQIGIILYVLFIISFFHLKTYDGNFPMSKYSTSTLI